MQEVTTTGARRWWALGAIVLSVLTIGFDATILSVALPTLSGAVHASNTQLQWIQDAYVLVFAGLVLPAGALGDRYGRRLMLMIGLSLFGVSSLVATLVHSAGPLIAIRAVMGVGAAILTPITLAVIRVIFPKQEQTKALAFVTIGTGLGIPLGPLVGGYLLEHFWWGSIFLVNVPVVALALIAIAALIPESKDPAAGRVDLPGTVLSTTGLVGFVYGIIEAPARGWDDPLVLGSIAGGLALLATFAWWQRRTAHPMIDLTLFGRPRFLWGAMIATLTGFALFGLLFVLPQYLQLVRGNGALGSGVRLLPLIAGLVVSARIGERLVGRFGNKVPVVAGMALTATGLFVGATTGMATGFAMVATWLVIVGLGVGMAMTPAMDAVLGSLPAARAGSGSALAMTMRQVGAALGVAILGSVLASAYSHRAPVGARDSLARAAVLGDPAVLAQAQHAFIYGMDVVLVVCGAVTLLGAVLAAVFLPARDTDAVDEEESSHEFAGVA